MILEDEGVNVHLFWPEVLKDGECDGFGKGLTIEEYCIPSFST